MKDKKADKKSKKVEKKAAKGKAKRTPPKLEPVDYGIDYVAKKSGLEPATVRAKLRTLGVKKDGRQYDFGSAREADKIVSQMKKAA